MDDTVNASEAQERAHLESVLALLRAERDRNRAQVGTNYDDVIELKQYLQDSKSEMDHVEKISVRQTIEQTTMVGEHRLLRNRQLSRLLKSPYFGRVDFRPDPANGTRTLYIGVHSFQDPESKRQWVHDWRAPISSLFYDFELGPAFYDAPEGRTAGELTRKRQYRIENGRLRFLFDTSLNIHDEVLQQELGRASSERMRNIVATIQRDQNAIIRNDEAHTLIIQGAAGSGKTSIALHRIAYLLYRFKDSLRSEEVLIVSPNSVFGHYIANVLPELGEEAVNETTMEKLADHLLGYRVAFEGFYAQVAALLKGNEHYTERVRFKATPEFLVKLEAFAHYVRTHNLTPGPVQVGRHEIETAVVENLFRRLGREPFAEQINHVTEALVARAQSHHGVAVTGAARTRLRNQLKKMFWSTEVSKLYTHFYEWLGAPEMLKKGKGKVYEYADVYPLIYLGILIEGVQAHDRVKHLVVDEMQDYTPVQYRVLERLFSCNKTILGDQHQSVNPYGGSTAESIRTVFPKAHVMAMHKSYRSTVEILAVAQHIHRNPDLIPMERHGPQSELLKCAGAADELRVCRERLAAFAASGGRSLGVICKTQAAADTLYEQVRDVHAGINLLNPKSTLFSKGIVIVSAHLAKGLEFDHVLVPHCSRKMYHTRVDKHMLYVACTRAMHGLGLTYSGTLTPFLADAPVDPAHDTDA